MLRIEKSAEETGEKHGEMGRLHRAKEGADHIPELQGWEEDASQGTTGRLGFPGEHRLAVPAIV